MRNFVVVAGAAVALTLAGCGGGGGGGGGDDPIVDPNVAWAQSAGGTGVPTGARSVAALSTGGVVTVGTFEGQATFGAGLPNATTLASAGFNDSFLASYAADGTFRWAKGIHGNGLTYVAAVSATPDGGFAVAGLFDGSITLGAGEPNETTIDAAGVHDAFVARYASNGTLAWARRIGSDSYDQGLGVAGMPDGGVAVSGLTLSAALTFGAGEPNETTLSNATLEAFVARYAADGSVVWARGTESSYYAIGGACAAGSDGSVALIGGYGGSTTFGEGEANQTTLTSTGQGASDDVFVAKYGPNGSLAWARTVGGSSSDAGLGVAIAADGSVALTGSFYDDCSVGVETGAPTVLTSPGHEAMLVATYDAAGTFRWARQARAVDGQFGSSVGGCVAFFADGGVGVTGSFRLDAVFGFGEVAQTTLSTANADDRDGFVARFQPDGSLDWARSVADVGTGETMGLATLADGSFYVCGYFEGVATLGAGDPEETQLTAVGTSDMYVARVNGDGGF